MNDMTQPSDRRFDLACRQFIDEIIIYLRQDGEPANALMNMNERGVPKAVQQRVLSGQAVIYGRRQ